LKAIASGEETQASSSARKIRKRRTIAVRIGVDAAFRLRNAFPARHKLLEEYFEDAVRVPL